MGRTIGQWQKLFLCRFSHLSSFKCLKIHQFSLHHEPDNSSIVFSGWAFHYHIDPMLYSYWLCLRRKTQTNSTIPRQFDVFGRSILLELFRRNKQNCFLIWLDRLQYEKCQFWMHNYSYISKLITFDFFSQSKSFHWNSQIKIEFESTFG